MSKRQWPWIVQNFSRFWFFVWLLKRLLRRLLKLSDPGRHHSIHARVGDRLAEVLAEVSSDGDEGTAQRRGRLNMFCGLSASASLRALMTGRTPASGHLTDDW